MSMIVKKKDYLWLHVRDLPYFRGLLRAVEARFYMDVDLPEPCLDLGCGDGHFAKIAFDRPLEVGLDPWWGPIKVHGEPSGVYFLNNTYVGEFRQLTPMSNLHLRNNLLLGQGITPRVLSVDTFTNYSTSDYNGFRPNPESDEAFAWNSPPLDEIRNFYPERHDSSQNAPVELIQRAFPTLEAYAEATGKDLHSRLVDYDIFINAPMPDFSDPTRVVNVDSVDLRLKKGAAAIDAGIELPNITDGFSGKAPDLGAYEFGEPLPHYGPRSR